MESFAGRLAVVTGGGSGMGRELVVQLAAADCSVAACDLNADAVAETASRAQERASSPTLVTAHLCDVAEEEQVLRFRDEVLEQHERPYVDLLFNNAGIGGGGSLVTDPRAVWERTFAVDWWGVYFCTRAFLPLLMQSDDAMLVNTSSVNGFWASLGPGIPHTAYSTAKFAVKGFSEALIEDLRVNAPHVKVAVVMPGHIGTDIFLNTQRAHGLAEPEAMSDDEVERWRADLRRRGLITEQSSADDIRLVIRGIGETFKRAAPTDASEAATVILDGVRAGKWRILVGRDAEAIDARVRADPDSAYDHSTITAGLRTTLR
jgi:NAD(P)-dependent dehydrogenase (short-subunit alcohol dehydrogenase family)